MNQDAPGKEVAAQGRQRRQRRVNANLNLRQRRNDATATNNNVRPSQTQPNFADVTCIICATNEIEYFMVPCGHTMCGACCNYLRGTCFTSRGIVTNHLRFFY